VIKPKRFTPPRRDGLFVLAGYALIVIAAVVIDLGVRGFGFGLHQLRAFL